MTPHQPRCSVCTHSERPYIDQAIADGVTRIEISRRFDLSKEAVSNHFEKHLTAALTTAAHNNAVLSAEHIVMRLTEMDSNIQQVVSMAMAEGDHRATTAALGEARAQIKLVAELVGKLQPEGTTVVNVMALPEWLLVRSAILEALQDHPDARLAVAEKMRELDVGDA